MESFDETAAIAARQIQLEVARNEYLTSQQRIQELSGVRQLFGGLMLKHATKSAEAQGLIVINGNVIVPRVVSLREFNSIDDDTFSFPD